MPIQNNNQFMDCVTIENVDDLPIKGRTVGTQIKIVVELISFAVVLELYSPYVCSSSLSS